MVFVLSAALVFVSFLTYSVLHTILGSMRFKAWERALACTLEKYRQRLAAAGGLDSAK